MRQVPTGTILHSKCHKNHGYKSREMSNSYIVNLHVEMTCVQNAKITADVFHFIITFLQR